MPLLFNVSIVFMVEREVRSVTYQWRFVLKEQIYFLHIIFFMYYLKFSVYVFVFETASCVFAVYLRLFIRILQI